VDARLEVGRWTLTGGYSFAAAEVIASGAAAALDGLRPAQTPRHSAAATFAWSPGNGAAASLTAHYVGNQFEDDLNRQMLGDAFTLDAALLWPVSPNLSLEARAENMTDQRVEAAISGDGIVERATPRTIWFGLRISG